MQTVAELSLLVGGFLAFGLAPAAAVLARAAAPDQRARRLTIVVAALAWGAWLAQFVAWRFAFDEPLPGETVPNSLMPVADALAHVSSAGCLVLFGLATTFHWRALARRISRPVPPSVER